MYRVEVDWTPAYELVVSLNAYLSQPEHKGLELGAEWPTQVRQGLQPEFAAELDSIDEHIPMHLLDLTPWLCPDKQDVAGFLRWLGDLSVGDLYERLAPYAQEDYAPLPRDLGATREWYVRLLTAWDAHYFRSIDAAILDGLARDAIVKRALVATTPPVELVELATSGVLFEPTDGPELVLLVPQYHFRPWNLNGKFHGLRVIKYPVDAVTPEAGAPSPGLLRATRALADENRLRILRFLATTPRNFTAIVQFTGLAKSTVHHHMVALRASGLVRVHDIGDGTTTYSLRPSALHDLGDRLETFLHAE